MNPFTRATYVVVFTTLALAIATSTISLRAALLPIAVLFGWAQIGGL